jgi:iron(III) transport system ATP-binding protein
MPGVTLKGVTKRFGTLIAVNQIDLEVRDGEVLTLLGPSGCGKTTTLRMIAGLEEPDAGTIDIGGTIVFDGDKRIDVPSERRSLGMVFQSYAIWPHMTVADNVAYPLRMRNVSNAEIKRLVYAVLDQVGLKGYEETPAPNLSGGQQQRVALARSLVFEPKVLLLDEPLSNLDAKLREQMRFELRIMQQRLGLTALYVTHDQEEALTLSDRVVVMNHGVIEQLDTPTAIYENPASRFVAEFIGKANFLDVAQDAIQVASDSTAVPLRTYDSAINVTLGPDALRKNSRGGADAVACLFIRPEKIKIVERSANQSGEADVQRLPGRILSRAYLGDHMEYLVGVNESTDLRVPAMVEDVWAEGSEIDLAVQKKDIFLYA